MESLITQRKEMSTSFKGDFYAMYECWALSERKRVPGPDERDIETDKTALLCFGIPHRL